jgi:hypothetical protein
MHIYIFNKLNDQSLVNSIASLVKPQLPSPPFQVACSSISALLVTKHACIAAAMLHRKHRKREIRNFMTTVVQSGAPRYRSTAKTFSSFHGSAVLALVIKFINSGSANVVN